MSTKHIQELAVQLREKRKFLAETELYLELVEEDRMKKIRALEQQRTDIDDEIAMIRLQMKEAHPDNGEIAEQTQNEIARLERDIKAACHDLDINLLAKKGMKIQDDDDSPQIAITVTKAQITTVFNTDAVLRKYPSVADMVVDGVPVIERSINSEALAGAVEDGAISNEVFGLATIKAKRRPSVRIKYYE